MFFGPTSALFTSCASELCGFMHCVSVSEVKRYTIVYKTFVCAFLNCVDFDLFMYSFLFFIYSESVAAP